MARRCRASALRAGVPLQGSLRSGLPFPHSVSAMLPSQSGTTPVEIHSLSTNRICEIDSNRDPAAYRRRRSNSVVAAISVAALVLDLGAKAWVRTSLPSPDGLDLIPFVALRPRYNEGTTFGLLSGHTTSGLLILMIVNAFAILVLWRWAARTREWWVAVGTALMAAGALGNLIDRLMTGMVTDFIDLHLGSWQLPIFNLADVWMIIGALLALYGPPNLSKTKPD